MSLFSLKRFFHQEKKDLPCWLAGRFYPEGESHYQLKSQGLSILCERKGSEPEIKTGAWLAVQLLSKKNDVYQIGELQFLNSGADSFSPADFSYERKGRVMQDWQAFLKAVRGFFDLEGLACVETPDLVLCPGTEAHLQAFETSWKHGGRSKKMYLPTSPEMHLKKLLCQDWTDFFEIKKCYRNGELGRLHQPEFSMLEWYRAFYSTKDLMEETCKLLSFLKKRDFFKVSLEPFEVYTLKELFQKHLNFSLQPKTTEKELFSLLKDKGAGDVSECSFEDLFFLIFLNYIEPELPKSKPVFICDYPPKLRAFSRLTKEGWADRFELYWRGLELANAFYEVIDSKEQKILFEEHLKQRKDSVPMDEELISLMKRGAMPPCSGIAVGLDRLFLALYDKEDLKESRLFPFLF